MDDALLVRGGQRVGEGRGDLEEPFDREPAFRQHAIERLPLDELHREEVDFFLLTGRRLRPRLLDGVDGDDAGVIEGGEGLGFALESREAFGLRRAQADPEPVEGSGSFPSAGGRTFRATSRPSFVSAARYTSQCPTSP